MPYYYVSLDRMEGMGPFPDASSLIDENGGDDLLAVVLFIDDNGLITVSDYVDFAEAYSEESA
jgi:hypothetical protein